MWDRITPCSSVIAACLPTLAPLVKGRNLLDSLIRTGQSWFSFGRSTPSSSKSNTRKATGTDNAASLERLHQWEALEDGNVVRQTNVTGDIPLQDRQHMGVDGVKVTSSVNVDYSRNGKTNV
jgi:hypothetical protein